MCCITLRLVSQEHLGKHAGQPGQLSLAMPNALNIVMPNALNIVMPNALNIVLPNALNIVLFAHAAS